MATRSNNNVDIFNDESKFFNGAERIAERYGLNAERVMAVYRRYLDVPYDFYITQLDRAISVVGPSKGLELFDNEDLHNLVHRVFLVDYLSHYSDILLCSLEELACLTEEFISYLLSNREDLLKTGHPRTLFLRCFFLDWHLAKLYHFSFPTGTEPSNEDRARLEADRNKLFDLKVAILKELLQAVRRQTSADLWEKCLRLLTERFSAEEAEFYLRMDHLYMGYDVSHKVSPEEIPGLNRPGGLTDLLEVIGHYEEELTLGAFAKIRELLGELVIFDVLKRPILHLSNYFQAVGHPLKGVLDSALDQFSSFEPKVSDFWENYRNRINQALQNEFYEEVVTRVKIKRPMAHLFEPQMKTFSALFKSHLEITGKLPRVVIQNSEKTEEHDEYVFHKKNDFWTLIYEGRKSPGLKDEDGLQYIAYLLARPNEKIPVFRVYHLDKFDSDSSADYIKKMSEEELDKENLKISALDDAGEAIDPKAVTQYKNDLKDLQGEYEQAKRDNDIGRKEIIADKIQKLKHMTASNLGLGGRIRKAGDPNERARRAVTNSIRRSRDKIKPIDENLWRHLFHIHTGRLCSYTPEKPIPWKF